MRFRSSATTGGTPPPFRHGLTAICRVYARFALPQLSVANDGIGDPLPAKPETSRGIRHSRPKPWPCPAGCNRQLKWIPSLATSHRQNDAELCVAAHHSRVTLGRFLERIGFDQGAHTR